MNLLINTHDIVKAIRGFFDERGVIEVDTPLLSQAAATDPHLDSLETMVHIDGGRQAYYLQTSPEFAMKRLLAQGSGPIYQIAKVFRDGEKGRLHSPEFRLLEWYRPGYDYLELAQEVESLLRLILKTGPGLWLSYEALFQETLSINPHNSSVEQLNHCIRQQGIQLASGALSEKDQCLQLLMTHCIEPTLSFKHPTIVYDFPASQAMLAEIEKQSYWIAKRFEVYFNGIELANGFQELGDPLEQQRRFESDLALRRVNQKKIVPIDKDFVQSLKALPRCAGVAVGLDRLIMLALNKDSIQSVINFAM